MKRPFNVKSQTERGKMDAPIFFSKNKKRAKTNQGGEGLVIWREHHLLLKPWGYLHV